MHKRSGLGRVTALVGSALVVALTAGCAGSQGSDSPAGASTGSPSVGAEASASESALLSLTPSPSLLATVLRGQPWGGLVWSAPAVPDMPWPSAPALVSWHGREIGIAPSRVGETENMVGEVVVASSTDWIHWTTLARGADLPFDHQQTVALGAIASSLVLLTSPLRDPKVHVWTSTDAVHWQIQDDAAFSGGVVWDMVAGPNYLLAGGYVSGHQADPVVWLSETGTDWQRIVLPGSTAKMDEVYSVTAMPGGFAAVGTIGQAEVATIGLRGGSAAAWYSSDGRKWSTATVEKPSEGFQSECMWQVASATHGLLATGGGGEDFSAAWSSSDGRAWKYIALSSTGSDDFTPAIPIGLITTPFASDGERLIAVSYPQGPEAWESFDGVTWRQLSMGGPGLDPSAVFDPKTFSALTVLPDGIIVFDDVTDRPRVFRAAAVP